MNNKIADFLSKEIPHEPIEKAFVNNLTYRLVKDEHNSTPSDYYHSLAYTLRDRLAKRWLETQKEHHKSDAKRVYYFSMEYLIGRLLKMNVDRLNLGDSVNELCNKLGINFDELEELENDPGLGNGGLGRLAACFMDSIAALELPCFGYGIRYDYGLFRQKFENGFQVEMPDRWLEDGYPWEIERPERYKVKFFGNTQRKIDKNGEEIISWINTKDAYAIPFDIPVPGFLKGTVNTLRLWSAKSDDDFRFQIFNNGDYVNAYTEKINDENITKILYPNDNIYAGRELRLKQEYFFTSASLQDILRRYKEDPQHKLETLPDKIVIQLNDTHPAISIPELIRLLVDEEGLLFDEAWAISKRTFAYTNHTLMPEALENWSEELLGKLLPRHLEIIYMINEKLMDDIRKKYGPDMDMMGRMSIIGENDHRVVKMAHLAVIGSFSVNGVSALHTELIKSQLLPDFYNLYPDRFNNKTNGITPRRWLYKCNTRLSHLITSNIGGEWLTDLTKLNKLTEHIDDSALHEGWQIVKHSNKKSFATYLENLHGIVINPNSLFDVQVKRMHEYKRQLLNVLHVIYQYLQIKNNPNIEVTPRTVLFSGKAAPGYQMAKLQIKLINAVSKVINSDPAMKDKLQVHFIPNYNVSLAEHIIPASDLSEQISTAGKEASGTGNMKFALNGALTIGTLDGANVEIMEEVGEENIFIFGLKAHEVIDLKKRLYNPQTYINQSVELQEVLSLLQNNFFCLDSIDLFKPIYNGLVYQDPFMIIADFQAYIDCQKRVSFEYTNKELWTRKSIINVAKSGKFSSDRTISEYNWDIWKVTPIEIKK